MKSSPLHKAEVLKALRVLMRSAHAEKGFLNSLLYQEADDANSIRYEEQWGTSRDFDDQVRSPRYTRLLTLMESAVEQPSLEFHFVSETHGLEYVAAVRGERQVSTASTNTTTDPNAYESENR